MIELLCRMFIKDYKQTNNNKVRESYGLFASIVGVVLNVLLSAAKLTVGLITGSVAIIGDATNNMSDVIS